MALDASAMRMTAPTTRLVLGTFLGLATAATIVLYILSGDTARFFAWTIGSPLTASMLGANYAGALTLFALSFARREWERPRAAAA